MEWSVIRHAKPAADRALRIAATAWSQLTRPNLNWPSDALLIDPTRKTKDEFIHIVAACRMALGQRRVDMNKGEYRVGINFNPSQDTGVDFIKGKAASLIMDIDGIVPQKDADPGEVARLKALACTAVEEAAMWAVKAITKQGKPDA